MSEKIEKLKAYIIKIFFRILEKRNKQRDITVIILSQIYILFLAGCLTFFIFKMITNFESSTIGLLLEQRETGSMIPRAFITFIIILIICEFFYFISMLPYVPLFIIYPVVCMSAIANTAKVNFRGEPFVFTDLLILKESADIASQYPLELGKYLPFVLPLFIFLAILPLFIRRVKFSLIKRVIAGSASFILTGAFVFYALLAPDTFIDKYSHSAIWNLADEYRHNGFAVSFIKSIRRSIVFAPPDYNSANVRDYALALGYPENYIMGGAPELMPNIIIIMNESYWDTANLTGIAFNKDPLESVRGIMSNTGSPGLLAPHLGGGTANIEFELLTGKNIIYYPPASMVYQLFVTRRHWSLASYFRDFGYSTTAIHPYYDWFWKRNTVYPLFGFENIYFDGDMIHTDIKGVYISDESVSREIISRYEQFSEGGQKPVFTFAVTMQNHGPYYARYSGDDAQIKLLNQLDEHHARTLENFAEGVRHASEAFIYLTEYFADTERPTFIIMFGDHAPAAIVDTVDFYAIEDMPGLSEEALFNRYVTPLIIWTNQADAQINNIGIVTAQMLNDEIFNITGMPKPAYIKMLEDIKNTTRGFTNQYIIDANGVPRRSGDFERIRDIHDKMRIVQYDATLGRNYFINELE